MKKTLYFIYSFIFLNFCLTVNNAAFSNNDYNNRLIAKFIFQVNNYIKQEKKRINLCIHGSGDVAYFLRKKSGSNRNTNILKNVKINQINKCDILYISATEESNLPLIFEATQNKPILTISYIEGFANSGGMFELYMDRNHNIGIYSNKKALKDSNIKVGYQLYGIIR